MKDSEVAKAIHNGVYLLREDFVPRRPTAVLKHPERPVTGNLKYNSLKIIQSGRGEFKVYIDEGIAPYMPYTNEPWISPKWKGAKNPNERWWQNFCKELINEIAIQLVGNTETLKRENE